MSDTETPEQSASTPTPQPTPRATRGRGRGRGRRPAVPRKEAAPKPAPTAGTGRRGRFKQFSDDKVQAAYERQRELKAQYAALANAVKPALQDLATRTVRRLTKDGDYYTSVPEFDVVTDHLQDRFTKRLAVAKTKLGIDQKMVLAAKEMQREAVQEIFENGLEDLEDRFLDAQIHRLDLLEYLHDHGLPIDLVDGGWNYKQISDKEASEFGIYEVYVDGHLVPYPQLIEGTEAHALRQAAWAEPQHKETAAAPAAAAPRTKRKARDQPDGQPASKRTAGDVAPANHIAGIMSAQHAPVEDESNESTPVPEGPVSADQREPPLPAKASEPDEYGCRQVNRPPAKNGAMIANRIIVPPTFQFDDDEIGYRDSTNSAKHGATVAKRGKYFGKPNSNTWHYDPLLARWDARLVEDDDMDKDLVEKHGVHPRYGYFLPTSKNDAEPPKAEADPMHPTVYLTTSGRAIHASRYAPVAKVDTSLEEKPVRDSMADVLSAVCDQYEIAEEDIEGEELKQLKDIAADYAEQRALAESIKESQSVEETPAGSPLPCNDSALNIAGLDDLVSAAEAVEGEEKEVNPVEEKPVVVQPPTPARTTTRAYDAIRDIFGDSEPATEAPPTPVIANTVTESADTSALLLLAGAITGDYQQQPVDVPMADAPPPVYAAPMDAPPHHMEPAYPMQAAHPDSQMSLPPPNAGGWVEPRLASPGPDTRIHQSIEHQLPPARPVEMSQMRASIETSNDGRRHSMYPEHNAPYYEQQQQQHMPPPHPQQQYPPVDPMIDPRLYSAPMEGPPPGHHDYHNTAYSQPQQPYHMSGMPMQGGPLPPAPSQMQQAGSSSRMPFTNPAQDRSSPLPPLRPSRGRKSAPAAPESIPPEHQQAQQQPPPPYMSSNSGSFYPPGPPRPYHNGYTNEQPGLPMMQPYPPYPGSQPPPLPQQQSYVPPGMSPTNASVAPVQSPPSLQFIQQQPNEPPPRSRAGSGSSTPSSAGPNSRYPKLAPAPIPPHRVGWPTGPELRTVQYDYKENIKDYAPTEPPPRRAPIQIRGWNINNNKIQRQRAEENGDERRGSR
ncbi:hypothetical protein COL26b_006412 [Colletotrichum chrysophilum]|uniref:Uncharacterized protein n=1 Tax=Colletotrichum chrysophilum TaxID=1836956 RepID=A0AAD9AF37_9PEZI|nr:uncharacterized protein COL26b_006412 [Colletotrichum chrysophilum]KAJ0375356.1 hypothetical protein COL26b_006412 [Colletotrichum chrysophilum]KAK1847013.1 hypothetical protein CCHR01_10350 [Colletotrichum chrysophilum]